MMIVILTNQGLVDAKVAKLKDKEGKLSRVLRAVRPVRAAICAERSSSRCRRSSSRRRATTGSASRSQAWSSASRPCTAPGGKSFWDHTDSD